MGTGEQYLFPYTPEVWQALLNNPAQTEKRLAPCLRGAEFKTVEWKRLTEQDYDPVNDPAFSQATGFLKANGENAYRVWGMLFDLDDYAEGVIGPHPSEIQQRVREVLGDVHHVIWTSYSNGIHKATKTQQAWAEPDNRSLWRYRVYIPFAYAMVPNAVHFESGTLEQSHRALVKAVATKVFPGWAAEDQNEDVRLGYMPTSNPTPGAPTPAYWFLMGSEGFFDPLGPNAPQLSDGERELLEKAGGLRRSLGPITEEPDQTGWTSREEALANIQSYLSTIDDKSIPESQRHNKLLQLGTMFAWDFWLDRETTLALMDHVFRVKFQGTTDGRNYFKEKNDIWARARGSIGRVQQIDGDGRPKDPGCKRRRERKDKEEWVDFAAKARRTNKGSSGALKAESLYRCLVPAKSGSFVLKTEDPGLVFRQAADCIGTRAGEEGLDNDFLSLFNTLLRPCWEHNKPSEEFGEDTASFPSEDELKSIMLTACQKGENNRKQNTKKAFDPLVDKEYHRALRETDKGKVIVCNYNTATILMYKPKRFGKLTYNSFARKFYYEGPCELTTEPGEPLKDADYTRLAQFVDERFFYNIPSVKSFREHAQAAAFANSFDPLCDYVRNLPAWDGNDRVGQLVNGLNVASDRNMAYKMFKKWLIGGVARALCTSSEGVENHQILVLSGEQGDGKTDFFKALSPEPSWHDKMDTSVQDKDTYLKLQGRWIVELDELSSLEKSGREAMKSFITSPVDTFRPPYGYDTVSFPRRCILGGTTNEPDFLTDPTGNRRYWVIKVGEQPLTSSVRVFLDAHRDQLWAQAKAAYDAGEAWWQNREEQKENERYLAESGFVRENTSAAFLSDLLENRTYVSLLEVRNMIENSGTTLRVSDRALRDFLKHEFEPQGTPVRNYRWADHMGQAKVAKRMRVWARKGAPRLPDGGTDPYNLQQPNFNVN